ncbi:hypothetical protein [Streptomyces solicathayae]|uniref:HTH HARE-type domain-containing protein n=1 Tax=Streptomyces solicathayae TaxID=3081768 RepID=A0ABZ0LV08_9ACTN|nr:hypothetical protein [Streptomyces sp. HUAS YS2]WOX23348.1 hypothetical protein R2D22_18915 [Streptomyces sp. HUAS YS2]
MGENQALRRALGVAQRQLAEAESELREVQERVHNLRSVVYGLKQIFEPGDSVRSHEGRQADGAATPVSGTAVSASLSRRDAPSLSLRRAAQVLLDSGRPMRMQEIVDEWRRRGWVDPTWKAPKSAINMTYQRALRAGLVDRMPDRSWVASTPVYTDAGDEPRAGEGG